MAYEKVISAINDIKNGKMIVMVDDEDRENEGDLVFAADFCTMEQVNFAISNAKGVLCLAMDDENAKRLELTPMVAKNTSSHETAFTVSIDAKNCTTGVSAFERNMTIKLAANGDSKASDFVRPGHIFPLIAKSGGVLVRTGHTEGSVDLCRLAGLRPMAAICEIVKEDGNMARRKDLEKFCEKYGLNMLSVSELVEYRLSQESLINIIDTKPCKVMKKDVLRYDICDHENARHVVYAFGEIGESANIKFVKSVSDFDFINSQKFDDLLYAIEILKHENGLLIFISNQANSSNTKDYGLGAQILKHFGVKHIKLLSSNKNKEFVGISGFGLDISYHD
ncbi:MAG: bifunctional 3,4-dihydroxy-2-butanone 4-phosphate synthase/GTP cyclohydrolase II [Campylobacter sp.]|nr:bifunctional 3,4-dihydroxy-2-butanone 4-phosphate synthase/GTP cyclohydrolase II [Campylobacter sp.]